MLRNDEKAERDERVADELEQDDRLAATLEKYQSQNDRSAEGSPKPTSVLTRRPATSRAGPVVSSQF
jgi:hypothetical protein